MTKEDILKIIEGKEVDVATLNKNNSYIISFEVGDIPAEQMANIAKCLANSLERVQIKHFVIVPTSNGIPKFKFYEFKDNQVSEVE